jgi:hypothetical protein
VVSRGCDTLDDGVKEPDRSHDGDWEAALEAVEQLTVAVSRVVDAGALESA